MHPNVEDRRRLGSTQYKIHRINGESVWQDAVDARHTVRNHPEEWSFTPFSADDQKAAQKDIPLDPERVAA